MGLQLVQLLNPIRMTIAGTFNPMGAYNGATNYAVGDQVDYNGSSYIMYVDAGAGTLPTNTTYWGLIAEKGDTGATGATGATGSAGADGADGNTVLSGVIDPTTEGVNGDFYINTANDTIFGPKTAGVWGSATSLVGPTGAAGSNGTNGTDGVGVPAGGTAGQALTKIDGSDYNTQWTTPTAYVSDPGSNGMLARTALNTTVARTITGTTNQVTVTNGDGVSGNPTLSLPQDIHTSASPTFAGATLNSTLNMNDGRIDIPADNYTISDPPIKFIYPDMTDNEDSKGAIIEWGGVMDGASHPYGIATYAYQQNPAATFTAPSGYKKWAWVTAHYDSPLSTGEDVHQHLNLETVKADWLTAITRFQISFGEDVALVSFPNSHVKVYPDKNFQIGSDSEGLFVVHDTANARINMTHKKPIRFQDGNTSSALTLDFSSGNPRLFSSTATNMYIGDSGGYLNFAPAAASGSPKFSYERVSNTSGSLFRITGVGLTAGAGITQYGLKIDPTYNQTSTASGVDLLIDRTETAVGSGAQYLINAMVGGVTKFNVTNTGNVYVGNSLSLAGTFTPKHITPQTDSAWNNGSSSNYWSNTYTDRLYLNSTVYLDGTTTGIAEVAGAISGSTSLLNAGNFTYNGGGSFINYNGGTAFNQRQSGMYIAIANSFAGTRSNRLSGFDFTVLNSVSQTASALYGAFGTITANAASSVITAGAGFSSQLSLQNKASMSIGSYFGVQPQAIASNLAGANTMTITSYGGISIPAQAAVTNLTITTQYGLLVGDLAGGTTNYAIYTGTGLVHFGDTVDLASGKNLALLAGNITTDTTTGTKIGTATSQKISLWNATPIIQPTTGVTAATFVTNTSLIANDTATFDGYTIGQVVKALRNIGILA